MLAQLAVVADMQRQRQEAHQASHADEAVAALGEQILIVADADQQLLQRIVRHARAPAAARLAAAEDGARGLVYVLLHHLERIGEAIDDRVEQVNERHRRRGAHLGLARDMRRKAPEGPGIGVAHRHEMARRQHEADRRAHRIADVDAAHDVRGEKNGAALLIEAARRLDLGHLLARRHLETESSLDERLLLACRLEQVDPDGSCRQDDVTRRGIDHDVAVGAVLEDPQHHHRLPRIEPRPCRDIACRWEDRSN